MKNKTIKSKLNNFLQKNGDKVMIGIGVLGVLATGVYILAENKRIDSMEFLEDSESSDDSIDQGRDCLITFTVEETGEVLWRDMCTEGYIEDIKESGMEYEAVRKLNGLE